ncbi:Proline--tRNA ligase [Metallosphaera sp. J1]|uniref:glycine--tRNA ligase n=1 Tax=Metallosphaera TaxID=41980 RepID=UPI001EDE4107|nr:glycine--tRNA ligase [Metallosphaera javensis (ex Hofmann et al. 2022)]MCG3107946.1 Proline--tRNA ligase [Metallosphaera javensis (ex Hofmann et al. 2022)]BCS91898.1 MAG: glycine--tRNA ligase [Metallosphaera javensis (ex Sakai et al. 2022)]
MPESDKVIELAKRRGIFWPSYEIYGGVAGLYDIGPIGTRIKNKIINTWRKIFVEENSEFVVEIETPMITPSKVLEASGHVENFTDPIVECTKCHKIYRADHLVEEMLKINVERLKPSELTSLISEKGLKCPSCGGDLGEVRSFNLLFSTNIGPYSGNTGYLRPETAQGMFTSFKRVYETTRQRLPLGIAQVGRVARNEISPRQGLVRMREFTIMEVEFFIDPEDKYIPWLDRYYEEEFRVLFGDAKEKGLKPTTVKVKEMLEEKLVVNPWMSFWMASASKFVQALGIPKDNFYFEEKLPTERAHYSSQTFDQIVEVMGEKVEISGHAYRGNYDLSRHSKFSNEDLTVFKKFDQPRTVIKKTVIVNRDKFKDNPELQKEVMKLISGKSPEQVEELLNKQVQVAGRQLSEFVRIMNREEKEHGVKFYPHVVEPSFGVERCLYLSVLSAYREKKDRVVLALPKNLAPYQVAVFPLLERDELIKRARDIYSSLSRKYEVLFDDAGSIGKRYARVDEIGVPYAITVDPQTLSDDSVTVRDRDTWNQIRVKISDLEGVMDKLFSGQDLSMLSGEAKR